MRLLDCVDQDIDYIGGKLTTYKNLHSQAMNGVWPGLLPPCRSGSKISGCIFWKKVIQ
ncbi:MAG: hypothetical protein HFF70_10595 [Oscillospiraceae bacterium]|jgi:hypothetical protein|nr:hypothetical protein [Oscillospiraceae bacterium]